MKKKEKVYKTKNKPITIVLSHRIDRVLLLLPIPVLLVFLICNFSVSLSIFSIVVSLILCFLYWWLKNHKIVIYDDKILLHNLKTNVFKINKIQCVSLEEFGYISFLYNDKIYKTAGIIDSIDRLPIEEKNKEIIEIIGRKIMKSTKRNKVSYNNTSTTISVKRMWTISLLFPFVLMCFSLSLWFLSKDNITLFIFTIILLVVCFLLIIYKILSPKKIIEYDSKNRIIIINKLFKTLKLEVEQIAYYTYHYKGFVTFKLKNKKRIYVIGIRNVRYTNEKLRQICKVDFDWWL